METLILFWRELEKKLFKIKFGKYQWGFLRQAVYHQLNQPFVDYQLPVQALEYLAGQIDYGPVNKISVIIPTRDRLASLKQYALDSLRQINFSPDKYEIIIVDNSISDETYQYLSSVKWPKNYQIFRLTKPGICRAYNLGVKSATGDVITFLDDDCRVDQELLNRIYFSHQAGHYLLREGLIYDEAEKTILNRRDHPEKERNFLDGNISYRREVFDFASFNEDIIYGWDGWDLLSQIFVFWPNFNCFYDQVPIKHYRQPSVYRDVGQVSHNRKGKKIYSRTHGLWQAGKYCLKRNLNIDLPFFALRFFFKEMFFISFEIFLVYGHLIWLIKSKIKIYRQLLKIKLTSEC